jgi:dethiobiotin synthetase/adenosylmethionine--8-amino-7-oxononanoate aminotransferase
MMRMDEKGEWEEYKEDWRVGRLDGGLGVEEDGQVWSVWGKEFVKDVSCRREVESVVALGTVLAINLRDANAGYTSTAATGLQKKLLEGSNEFKIHVRVLGNVLYMMASQTSKKETLQIIERLLLEELA